MTKRSWSATGPVIIYGGSDDLIEMEGGVEDEINSSSATLLFGEPEPSSGRNAYGIIVRMKYDCDGTWAATVKMLDEGVHVPWPISISTRPDETYGNPPQTREGYSVQVEIGCPDGTPITRMKKAPTL